MIFLRETANWWRRTVVCDHLLRQTFYRLLEAQIRSGISLLGACRTLADQALLDKVLRKLGTEGAMALTEGRLASEGWANSGYLSAMESGVLKIAEQSGTLSSALSQLADPAKSVPTFIRNVLRPNIAQVLPFVLAFGMTLASPMVLNRIVLDVAALVNVPLYAVATWFHSNGLFIGLLVGAVGLLVGIGRSRWVGRIRGFLGGLGRDWLAQLTIRYCRLASMLTKEGATHRQTLAAFQRANDNAYTRRVIPAIERDVLDGRSFADSLSGRLLAPELAGLLDAFVPGDDRLSYPTAFESLAEFQEALLRTTYTVWARGFKLLLMTGSAGLIVLLLHGLLSATRNLTQQIGIGF